MPLLKFPTHDKVDNFRGRLALNVEIAAAKFVDETFRCLVVRPQNTVIAVARAVPKHWSGPVHEK
jgi:hypothetical protein